MGKVELSGSPETLNALNQHIVEAMIADGYALVLSTVLRGNTVLRLCMNNPRTTDNDIRETIARLENIGATLSGERFITGRCVHA